MSLLLQISDPHFGTEQAPVMAALQALVKTQKPDALVVSGDITQRARRSQFADARRFFDSLKIPRMLSLPGNHDLPLFNLAARVLNPYANYQREFGPDLEPILDWKPMMIIGVNTTVVHWHKDGRVRPDQVLRVCERLYKSPSRQLRVVVVHQPVHVPRLSEKHNLLVGRDAAVRAWTDAGADLILGGHIHLPYVRPLAERYPGLSRRIWAVQAGTALSDRIREDAPNSVNLIRYVARAQPMICTVERWDCLLSDPEFRLVESHRLGLDRGSNEAA